MAATELRRAPPRPGGGDGARAGAPPGPFHLGYQPAFDGLRGLGVMTFIVYHGIVSYESTLNSWFFPGAYLWLEIFFVQSGFLITSLLLEEWFHRGNISLRHFYARRALRLLPALFAVVIVVSIALLTFSEYRGNASAWREVWGGLFYVQNWLAALDPRPFPFYLSHVWSLSIEEQFYLVAPVVLLVLLRLGVPLRRIVPGLLVAALASAAWMAYLLRGIHDDSGLGRLYYATDTRAQAFFVGMALACAASAGMILRTARARRAARAGAWIGVPVLVTLLMTADIKQRLMYNGFFLVCSLSVAAMLTEIVQAPGGALARGLSWKPLRWTGAMTYGLYLWHWPVMLFVRQYVDWPEWPLIALQVTIGYLTAVASFFLIERPLLRRFAPRFARIASSGEWAQHAPGAPGADGGPRPRRVAAQPATLS